MISMEILGKIRRMYFRDKLSLAAPDSQAYRAVEKHHPEMGQSARSHSAGVPAVRDPPPVSG